MKRNILLLTILAMALTLAGCTKRPVKANRSLNGSAAYSEKSSAWKNINIFRSTGNVFKNLFSGFNKKGAPIRLNRSQVMVFLVILGGVLLTTMVFLQNRPKKPRHTKGKYRI